MSTQLPPGTRDEGASTSGCVAREVEVIYADASRVLRARLAWHSGMTATAAIASAQEVAALGAALDACGLAVWGVRVLPDHALQPGDRLEIMPPLPNDPKVSRRQRVVDARARSRADASRTRNRT